MLEIKKKPKNLTETNNAFAVLISRLDMAGERISELEDVSIESSKTEKQREQRLKTTEQNAGGRGARCTRHKMGMPEGREILERIITEHVPKLM